MARNEDHFNSTKQKFNVQNNNLVGSNSGSGKFGKTQEGFNPSKGPVKGSSANRNAALQSMGLNNTSNANQIANLNQAMRDMPLPQQNMP